MIIIHEELPNINLLRFVVGHETEIMMKLNGLAMVDITPFLSKFSKDKPRLKVFAYDSDESQILPVQ